MNTRRPALILSFTLLVVMLGYGMVLPIVPFYIQQLGAGGRELGWLMATYAFMQLIFAPLWGMLSDWVGRHSICIATRHLFGQLVRCSALGVLGRAAGGET